VGAHAERGHQGFLQSPRQRVWAGARVAALGFSSEPDRTPKITGPAPFFAQALKLRDKLTKWGLVHTWVAHWGTGWHSRGLAAFAFGRPPVATLWQPGVSPGKMGKIASGAEHQMLSACRGPKHLANNHSIG